MSDLDNNRRLDPRDSDGISTGTIAAIIAVVVIIGALLLWHPWNANNGTASNSSGTTTKCIYIRPSVSGIINTLSQKRTTAGG